MDQYKGSDVDTYRCFMSGEGEKNTTWKDGTPPNFDALNKLFEQGRTKIWPPGSLGEQVQNLVKTWEMEMFYKVNPQDFKTVDATKLTVSVNGKLRLYNPNDETKDTAHEIFTTTFSRGFVVEVLEVYSGPPVIAYKFRHWGYMDGPFKGYLPTKEIVEMFGVSIFTMDEQFKIVKIEFFYDSGELLAGLIKGGCTTFTHESIIDKGSSTSRCPFS